jgi:Uma2 family endonuclease
MTRTAPAFADDMSIAEFQRFVDGRPDWEKWELIHGEPILNAAPAKPHQLVVVNIIQFLANLQESLDAEWQVLPGLDVPIETIPPSVPVPDVLVVATVDGESDCPVVAIEILSPTTRRRDRHVKPGLYAQVQTLTDYVIVDPLAVSVEHLRRSNGFRTDTITSVQASITLEGLGVALPLARIYRKTGLDR